MFGVYRGLRTCLLHSGLKENCSTSCQQEHGPYFDLTEVTTCEEAWVRAPSVNPAALGATKMTKLCCGFFSEFVPYF